jgi:hypothetical protein
LNRNKVEAYLSDPASYIVFNQSVKGFSIILAQPLPYSLQFSWTALAVKDAKVVLSKPLDATVENTSTVTSQPGSQSLPLPVPESIPPTEQLLVPEPVSTPEQVVESAPTPESETNSEVQSESVVLDSVTPEPSVEEVPVPEAAAPIAEL